MLHLSSSEALMRLVYQILLKSSPLTLLAGSAPGLAVEFDLTGTRNIFIFVFCIITAH